MLLRYWAKLYSSPTDSEKAIEPAIAALGEPYRAQHPFFSLKHIADFVLLNRKLIIEVDGDSHSRPAQIKKDLEHTIALKALGYEVIRVTNEQAQAIPEETVKAALRATPQTLEELQRDLARLKVSHPKLFEPKPKKAYRKRGAGRRKRKVAARRQA